MNFKEDRKIMPEKTETLEAPKKKKSVYRKGTFDMDNIGKDELSYMNEKRRYYVADDMLFDLEADDYVETVVGSGLMTDADYYKKERDLFVQSAAAKGNNQLIFKGRIVSIDKSEKGIWFVKVRTYAMLDEKLTKEISLDIKNMMEVRITADQLMFDAEKFLHYYDADPMLTDAEKEFKGNRKLQKELEEHRGADIYFVSANVQADETNIVYGSRIAAMVIMMQNSFLPTIDHAPRITVGKRAAASVVSVGMNKVIVEVDGCDIVLTRKDLSWLTLENDLRKEFKTRDKFWVRITDIGIAEDKFEFRGSECTNITVKASKILAEKDPAELYKDYFRVGSTADGVIKSELTADGVYVNLGGMIDCICDVQIDEPIIGADCKVRILKYEQKFDAAHQMNRWYAKGLLKDVCDHRRAV